LQALLWGLLPLFVLAHFGHHLLTALPVPLLPMIRRDFGLDYTQSGVLLSAFTLSYGIGQLPAGWLADRIGRRALITAGICGVAVAGVLVGLSQGYVMMIGCLVLMGILGGGYHPAAPPLIAASVDPRHWGRALGLHIIGGSASYFLAPLAGVAVAAAWGWRGAFVGLALPTVVFGIVFFVLLGRRTSREAACRPSGPPIPEPPRSTRRLGPLAAFMVLSTFASAVMVSAISFVPLFMVDHFGLGEKSAAAFLSIVYFAGFWAAPLGGYLSDRLGKVPVVIAVCLIPGPVIFLLTLAPMGITVGALLLVLGTCLSARMPISEAYIVSRTTDRNRSTVLGIYYFTAMEGGGVLTPVMGYCIDRFGFYSSFALAGAVLVTVTVLCSAWLLYERE